jgi:hypothetical protein
MKKHFVPYHVFVEEEQDGVEIYSIKIKLDLTYKGFDFSKPIMRYEDAQRGGFLYTQKDS